MMSSTTLPAIGANASKLFGGAGEAALSFGTPDQICTVAASAAKLVIEDYLPMVRAVARRIHSTLPRHIDLEDLVSAGYLGLLDAGEKFQESRQTQFRSYAEFRVRGAILDSLRELDWATRGLRRRSREIESVRGVLAGKLGRTPEDREIAADLGIEVSELRKTLSEAKSLQLESLQAEREDEDGQDLLSTLVDPSAKDALSLCLEGEFKQGLIDAIEALPERERLVISLSYYEELTLKEIGYMLSVTESRVCQLRSSAIARLRATLRAK